MRWRFRCNTRHIHAPSFRQQAIHGSTRSECRRERCQLPRSAPQPLSEEHEALLQQVGGFGARRWAIHSDQRSVVLLFCLHTPVLASHGLRHPPSVLSAALSLYLSPPPLSQQNTLSHLPDGAKCCPLKAA